MPEKPQSQKQRAHMCYKRFCNNFTLSNEERALVNRFYPFLDLLVIDADKEDLSIDLFLHKQRINNSIQRVIDNPLDI